jgi:hypothetical protein
MEQPKYSLIKEINRLISINSLFNGQSKKHPFRDFEACCDSEKYVFHFVTPLKIVKILTVSVERFIKRVQVTRKSSEDLYFAIAEFWFAFVSIHPFPDANGRTIQYYLREKMREQDICDSGLKVLNQLSIAGINRQDINMVGKLIQNG